MSERYMLQFNNRVLISACCKTNREIKVSVRQMLLLSGGHRFVEQFSSQDYLRFIDHRHKVEYTHRGRELGFTF